MVPWKILSALVAGASCSAAIAPRTLFGEADLAVLARQTPEAKYAMKRILRAVHRSDPHYMEAALIDVKMDNVDLPAEIMSLQNQNFDIRKLFWRYQMVPGSAHFSVDIHPNLEQEIISGHGPTTYTVSKSTAKIDTSKEGWSSEKTDEYGGSVSAEVGYGGVFISGKVSATVSGNRRWSNAENGEKIGQTEFKQDTDMRQECPARHRCSVQTWTYTTSVTGRWVMVPVYELHPRSGVGNIAHIEAANHSLASLNPVFEDFLPLWNLSKHFFELNEPQEIGTWKRGSIQNPLMFNREHGSMPPELFLQLPEKQQGVFMHRPELVKREKYEQERTFTYTLRKSDGEPYRTVVMLSEPIDKDKKKKSKKSGSKNNDKNEESSDGASNRRPVYDEKYKNGKIRPPTRSNPVPEADDEKKKNRKGKNEARPKEKSPKKEVTSGGTRPEDEVERDNEAEPEQGAQSNKTSPPRAIGWKTDKKGRGYCKLEDGWAYREPNRLYAPPADGEKGFWFTADPQEWTLAEGLYESCPELKAGPGVAQEAPAPKPAEKDGSDKRASKVGPKKPGRSDEKSSSNEPSSGSDRRPSDRDETGERDRTGDIAGEVDPHAFNGGEGDGENHGDGEESEDQGTTSHVEKRDAPACGKKARSNKKGIKVTVLKDELPEMLAELS